jgi:hypothetical protein
VIALTTAIGGRLVEISARARSGDAQSAADCSDKVAPPQIYHIGECGVALSNVATSAAVATSGMTTKPLHALWSLKPDFAESFEEFFHRP